jgi:hypothetical protein
MHGDPITFTNYVEFEVPLFAPVARFVARLGLAWLTAVEQLEDSALIIVELDPKPQSFARLLRVAEEWVCQEMLGAIRFSVDGRAYILESGELEWDATVAAAA